jgi:tetratricopeptide (TPR) repeat protein
MQFEEQIQHFKVWVHRWAKRMMARGVPCQHVCYLLQQLQSGTSVPIETISGEKRQRLEALYVRDQAYAQVCSELCQVMASRNLEGQACEAAGEIERAVALYEANVADAFDGAFPYDRLRAIYSSLGKWDEALRVCQAFVAALDTKLQEGAPVAEVKEEWAQATRWIDDLEARLGGVGT